ncbi:hypothetical protein GOBAR_AA14241 [Gossypium barbadense]|uniref:Malic enzyme N-terminal domain-containing protein n=1 Tax=Gossypium barbadense TaxID=3634 RepID=A0A2P5XST9_GOSBA|nr:hypothetical protein GOBAR_AA14241 [Gossypium barbadense]
MDPKSTVGDSVEDVYPEDFGTEDHLVTLWTYSVARDPRHNKGLAFTEAERDSHYLRGLLPPAVVTQQLQLFTLQLWVKLARSMEASSGVLKGKVLDVLKNWPERSIQIIVVIAGERILGLADLGDGNSSKEIVFIHKLGGVRPSALSIFDMAIFLCLPVTTDVGTNNEVLKDEFYIGLRQRRAIGNMPTCYTSS